MAKSALIDAFTDTDLTLVSRICIAIADDNLRTFDHLLPLVKDLETEQGRILRTCVENDRFTMARKVFQSGGFSAPALEVLNAQHQAATAAYSKKPSGKDAAERAEMERTAAMLSRLQAWKTCFHEEVLPTMSMKKMQELQDQITALRQEIADVISPARSVVKKQTPPSP